MLLSQSKLMLEVGALSFSFDEELEFHVPRWTASPGERIHLRGENGAGKSSYLKSLMLSLNCDFSYVNHSTPIDENDSLQNIVLYLEWLYGPSLATDWLKTQSMSTRKAKFYSLSLGQQRVFLFRALLNPLAHLWIIDEGWAHCDRDNMLLISEEIKTHTDAGGIVLYTDHQQTLQYAPSQILTIRSHIPSAVPLEDKV